MTMHSQYPLHIIKSSLNYIHRHCMFGLTICFRPLVLCLTIMSVLLNVSFSSSADAKDTFFRSLVQPPTLKDFQVFEWGLRHQGKREYTIYGRLIAQKQTQMTNDGQAPHETIENTQTDPQNKLNEHIKAVWMHRGQATQTIQWLKRKGRVSQSVTEPRSMDQLRMMSQEADLLTTLKFELSEPPNHFEDLNQLYILSHEQVKLSDDPVINSVGYTFEEQRIFQAYPPYHLVAFKRIYRQNQQAFYDFYDQGQWLKYTQKISQDKLTNSTQNMSLTKISTQDLEGLTSRLWDASTFHVGGGYTLPNEPNECEQNAIKVIDRRYERIGGLWLPVVEWSMSFMGALQARVSLDPQGMIRLIEFNEHLFAVPARPMTTKKGFKGFNTYKKVNLELAKRPLSLRILQKQPGRLTTELIHTMTQKARPMMQNCLAKHKNTQDYSSHVSQHLVFRLNTNASGRLVGAGATHQLSWHLTSCLLKSLDTLIFPRAIIPKAQTDNRLESLIYQGAMLAWPVDLGQLQPRKSQ